MSEEETVEEKLLNQVKDWLQRAKIDTQGTPTKLTFTSFPSEFNGVATRVVQVHHETLLGQVIYKTEKPRITPVGIIPQ